jgi:hypothetical protein
VLLIVLLEIIMMTSWLYKMQGFIGTSVEKVQELRHQEQETCQSYGM